MTPEQQEAAAKLAYEEHSKDSWEALPNKYLWLDLIQMVDNGLGNDPQNGPESAALKAYQTVIALAPGSVDIGPVLVASEIAEPEIMLGKLSVDEFIPPPVKKGKK
jgi:hypothetical protein